jgi:hypothetical protein
MTRKNNPTELAVMLAGPEKPTRRQVIDLDTGETIRHLTYVEVTELNNRGRTITKSQPCDCRRCH